MDGQHAAGSGRAPYPGALRGCGQRPGAARAAGATQAEADASVQKGLTVTVRLGEVDTIEYHRDRGMAITVYFGQSKGSASTADLRADAVRETVAKACTLHATRRPMNAVGSPMRANLQVWCRIWIWIIRGGSSRTRR